MIEGLPTTETEPEVFTCAEPSHFKVPSFSCLDIETVVADGVQRSEDDFPRPVEWRIVCVSIGTYRRGAFRLAARWGDERALLRRVIAAVTSTKTLVTYNGRRFDNPTLAAASMRLAEPFPWAFSDSAQNRYKSSRHVDLCDQLSNHGAAPSTSLDTWLREMGLPGKSAKGSDVAAWFAAGRLRDIAEYNADDIRGTSRVHVRRMLCAGDINSEQEQAIQAAISAAVAELGEVKA